MVKLSGLTLTNKKTRDSEIEIIITGLRPGEKLYEELLIDSKSEPTQHQLIFRANEKNISPNILNGFLDELEIELNSQNEKQVLNLMQKLIPEWEKNLNK